MKNKKILILDLILVIVAVLLIIYVVIIKDNYNNYIYNKKIKSITIRYYERGYSIMTGTILNTVPLNEIEVQSNDLKEISEFINNLTKISSSNIDLLILDLYEIEINGTFIIYIDESYGYVKKTGVYFEISNEFYNKILEIIADYEENIDTD